MSGQKIIDGLKEAMRGDLARVTIEGQTWVRAEDLTAAKREGLEEAVKIVEGMACHDQRVGLLATAYRNGWGQSVYESAAALRARIAELGDMTERDVTAGRRKHRSAKQGE